MASWSKTTILGNLGADPDVRRLDNGNVVATLSVATSEKWKDKDGNQQEKTEWHRVSVWNKTAELCEKYLSKGRQVLVEGQNETRKWQDKDGVDRYTTEIKAHRVVFLGGDGKREDSQRGQQSKEQPNEPPVTKPAGSGDSDFPF